MGDIHEEAKAGAFSTKGDAVHRRDELINEKVEEDPAAPAGDVASTDQAETADLCDSQVGVDVD